MCLVPQNYSHLMGLMSRQRISVQLWSRANMPQRYSHQMRLKVCSSEHREGVFDYVPTPPDPVNREYLDNLEAELI